VDNAIKQTLQDAYRDRAEGRTKDAEQAYGQAAQLARSNEDWAALAHALRHMSDLARERGALAVAWVHASEAVELYRKSSDRLGLANAIRLQALSAPAPEKARNCWREARELYASLGINDGVDECDSRLNG